MGRSKTETKVINTTPEWMNQSGQWANAKLQEAVSKQESSQNPYPSLVNPYADWDEKSGLNGLMNSSAGQQYLSNYTKPVENSVRNTFGANGLYGSIGAGSMSGALGSGLSQAQNSAIQAWNNDLLMQAADTDWNNTYLVDQWNASNAANQQYINTLMGMYGTSVPTIANGQVVQQHTTPSIWQTLAGTAGVLGGAAIMKCDPLLKEKIKPAEPVLDRLTALDIPTWQYLPEVSAALGEDRVKRHIGPMADQWAQLFGGDGKQILFQDALGVALKAIQELNAKLEQINAEKQNG